MRKYDVYYDGSPFAISLPFDDAQDTARTLSNKLRRNEVVIVDAQDGDIKCSYRCGILYIDYRD